MINEKNPCWYAVHTRYKSEKIVQRMLTRKHIESYLPLQKRFRRHGTKMLMSEIPLISCYIFVKITKADYVKVLETEYVVGFVRFAKDIYPIPDEELNLMHRIVDGSTDVVVEKNTFYEGETVEIATGNLAGLTGKLIEIEGKNRVLVELETIGFTLQISVEKQNLIKVVGG
jgi:transcription antitermination factor NusG